MPSQFSISQSGGMQELTLPSLQDPDNPDSPHNVCLVRRLDPAMLIASGLLDQLDSLTALVQNNHIAPKTGGKIHGTKRRKPASQDGLEALQQFAANRGDIGTVMDLLDRVVEMSVVDPKVLRPVVRDDHGRPCLDSEGKEIQLVFHSRVPGQIYTDMVDLNDRAFIVSAVLGGVKDLEPFRYGSGQALVDMADL